MSEKEVPSEEKEGKGSGCSKLLQAGFIVLGFVLALQVLSAIGDSFGSLTTCCFIGLIVIIVLIVVFAFQHRRKGASEWEAEPHIVGASSAEAVYQQGERLHSQGRREEAVAAILQDYREGSPAVRKQAITALENLGEVEEF